MALAATSATFTFFGASFSARTRTLFTTDVFSVINFLTDTRRGFFESEFNIKA